MRRNQMNDEIASNWPPRLGDLITSDVGLSLSDDGVLAPLNLGYKLEHVPANAAFTWERSTGMIFPHV